MSEKPNYVFSDTLGGGNSTASDNTTVTAGGSVDTLGSWTVLSTSDAGNLIIDDVYLMDFGVVGVPTNTTAHIIEIGIDPSGGTSYTTILKIPFETMYGTYNVDRYKIPIYIPKGAKVAARTQSSTASDPIEIAAVLYTGSHAPVYQFVELAGITGSQGVSVTDSGGWHTLIASSKEYDAVVPCIFPDSSLVGWPDGHFRFLFATEVSAVQYPFLNEWGVAGNREEIRGIMNMMYMDVFIPGNSKIVVDVLQDFADVTLRASLIGLKRAA